MTAMRIAILTTDMREAMPGCTDPQPHIGLAPEALLQGFALVPAAEVHVVSCLKEPLRSVEKIAPNIFYHGVAVPRLGWLRTGYQGCIRAVRKKLKEIQPDIVHGQGTERDCAISAVFSGFPNVVTVHGNMRMIAAVNHARPFSYLWLAAKLEGFTLPRPDGVVCISRYTQTTVAKLARKTWLLPNAVDASFFDVQAAPTWDTPLIGLCVGTICARKNQNDFIRALDQLAKDKKFKIIFAGGLDRGSYGAEFRQLISERPWCEHIGYINREQLRAQLKLASFLALPTREDNCPMVVLEAMAAGVPVLASAVGGVPELVEHEVNGLLCNPDQPETFCTAVARFLGNQDFASRIATTAKAQARQRFHPQVIAQKHLEIYRDVLGA
jgi:glycosyltransferase involved in cell wall biosynthesis